MKSPSGNPVRLEQIDKYNFLIPGLREARSQLKTTSMDIPTYYTKQRLVGTSKLSLLKNVAPEIFLPGYATICQQSEQPIPITFDEIPKWIQKKFFYSGKLRDRQILTFPPPQRPANIDPTLHSQWLFVCPNDITPFPGVKKNGLKNKGKYPYVPCCYMTDHMENNANYNKYYSDSPTKSVRTKTRQYINKTSKILPSGLFGEAPKNIKIFLGMNDKSESTYLVMGMPNTLNTLLDCILTAKENKEYTQQISIENKKQYVKKYRTWLKLFFDGGQIKHELLKQELYDQSPDQIISGLINTEIFMDPALYYRILEEIFDINIFVFAYKLGNSKNPDDFDQLEIPRHRNSYIRAKRLDRLTVIIYKHSATKDKGGTIIEARCELIIRKKNNINIYTYHPVSDNKIISSLFELFYETTSEEEWTIDSGTQSSGRQVTKKTILNNVNFPSFFSTRSITYQIVDDYGKLRGLIFSYSSSPTETKKDIIVITPPGQPINLSNWPGGQFPDPELVIEFFSDYKVTGASYINIQDKSIDGLWFQIHDRVSDRVFDLYYPIIPVITNEPYPIGPNSPINLLPYTSRGGLSVLSSLSKINRIRGLRKINNLILNIVKWLFSISRKNHNMTVNTFIRTYLISGPKIGGKSFSKYNLTDVPYRFPQVSSINDAIQKLSKITRGLVVQGRIYLYSQKYYNSISYFLREFEKNTDGLKIEIPVIIPGRLMDVDDFIVNLNNVIFMNHNELLNWLNSLDRDRKRSTNTAETIDKSAISLISPYIFTDIEGNSFLIQNAYSGKPKTTPSRKKPSAKTRAKPTLIVPVLPPTGQYTAPIRPAIESSSSNLQLVSPAAQTAIIPLQPPVPTEGFLRALKIAETWKNKKINLGYYSGIIDASHPLPPYILFSISTTKIPIIKENKSGRSPDPLMIIEYSEGYYAAILPL